jgi:hypothetical protein
MSSRRKSVAGVVLIGLWGVIVLLVSPPCAFNVLTGLYCPGCGGTRAVRALAQGDVLLALRQNAVLVSIAPTVAGLYLQSLLPGAGENRRRLGKSALWVLAISLVLFFPLRNIPLPLFDILRPL